MNKIAYIFVATAFAVALCSALFHKRAERKTQYNTIKFHYQGEIRRHVTLRKSGNTYIEDATVKNLKGGVIRTEEMSAKLSIIIMNSIFYNKPNNRISLPITVVNMKGQKWHNKTWLPRGCEGGRGYIQFRRANSEILSYGHTK